MADSIAAFLGSIVSAFAILLMIVTLASTPEFSSSLAPVVNGIIGSIVAIFMVGAAIVIAFLVWWIFRIFFER